MQYEHRLAPVVVPAPQVALQSGWRGVSQDEKLDISWLLSIFSRGKKLLIGTIVVALGIGALYCILKTRRYEAVAEIAVHPEGSGALNLETAESSIGAGMDWSSKLETEVRELKSSTLAMTVIGDLHLDALPEFNPYLTKRKKVPDYVQQAAILQRFAENLTVQSIPRTEAIQIKFRSANPVLAAQIVNDLSRVYQEHSFTTRYEATHQASKWLSKQLDDLKNSVEQAQQRLSDYQKNNGLIGADENNNMAISRLDQLSRQLTVAEADRITREAKYQIANSGDPALVQSIVSDPTLPALQQERAGLQNQLAEATTLYGPNYPRVLSLKAQLEQTQRSLDRTLDGIRLRFQNEYVASKKTEDSLRSELDQQKQEAYKQSESFNQYGILKEEVESGRALYQDLLQKLQEAGILAGLKSTNVDIIDPAVRPIRPVEPQVAVVMLFSLFAGSMAGIALVLLHNRLDQRVSTVDEVESISKLPMFGVIPLLTDSRKTGRQSDELLSSGRAQTALMSVLRPKAQFSEAFRSLRTALLLGTAGAPPKVIVVTGSIPGEGKTTVSSNCAAVLAQSGKRVLLVEADLRRGRLAQAMNLTLNGPGLSECLAGAAKWREVVQAVPDALGLDFLSRGAVPPSPADLLGSPVMISLIREWSEEYDHIVIDTPPALLVTDALVLGQYSDAMIVVARHHFSNRHAIRRTSDLVEKASPKIAGIVFNAFDPRAGLYGYGYEYGYGYSYGSQGSAHEAYFDESQQGAR